MNTCLKLNGPARRWRQVGSNRSARDAIIVSAVAVVLYSVLKNFDLARALIEFNARYGDWIVNDTVAVLLCFALIACGLCRLRDLRTDIDGSPNF